MSLLALHGPVRLAQRCRHFASAAAAAAGHVEVLRGPRHSCAAIPFEHLKIREQSEHLPQEEEYGFLQKYAAEMARPSCASKSKRQTLIEISAGDMRKSSVLLAAMAKLGPTSHVPIHSGHYDFSAITPTPIPQGIESVPLTGECVEMLPKARRHARDSSITYLFLESSSGRFDGAAFLRDRLPHMSMSDRVLIGFDRPPGISRTEEIDAMAASAGLVRSRTWGFKERFLVVELLPDYFSAMRLQTQAIFAKLRHQHHTLLDPPTTPRTTPEFGFLFHYGHIAAFTNHVMRLGSEYPLSNNLLFGCMPGTAIEEKMRGYFEQLDVMLASRNLTSEQWNAMHKRYTDVFAGITQRAAFWPEEQNLHEYYNEITERAIKMVKEHGYTPQAIVCIEHEMMHLETIMYLYWHTAVTQGDWEKLAAFRKPSMERHCRALDVFRSDVSIDDYQETVHVSGGAVVIGIDEDRVVGHVWDNEMPARLSQAADLEVMRYPVTNKQFRSFLQHKQDIGEGSSPVENQQLSVSQLFARDNHPAVVFIEEAKAYCRWRGGRLMSEVEYQNLFKDREDFEHCAESGNNNFKIADTTAVGSMNDATASGIHDLVGNGWEWTGTQFAAHDGYKIEQLYFGYSAPWFDGKHYVLKGAGCFTGSALLRPSFRNFARDKGPLMGKFRVAWDK